MIQRFLSITYTFLSSRFKTGLRPRWGLLQSVSSALKWNCIYIIEATMLRPRVSAIFYPYTIPIFRADFKFVEQHILWKRWYTTNRKKKDSSLTSMKLNSCRLANIRKSTFFAFNILNTKQMWLKHLFISGSYLTYLRVFVCLNFIIFYNHDCVFTFRPFQTIHLDPFSKKNFGEEASQPSI